MSERWKGRICPASAGRCSLGALDWAISSERDALDHTESFRIRRNGNRNRRTEFCLSITRTWRVCKWANTTTGLWHWRGSPLSLLLKCVVILAFVSSLLSQVWRLSAHYSG